MWEARSAAPMEFEVGQDRDGIGATERASHIECVQVDAGPPTLPPSWALICGSIFISHCELLPFGQAATFDEILTIP